MLKFTIPSAIILLIFMACPIRAEKCVEKEEFYFNKYKIREVRISAPLGGILGSVDQKIKDLLTSDKMPLKKGTVLLESNLGAAKVYLKEESPALSAEGERVAVRFMAVGLENCDSTSTSPELDVVFKVIVFRPSYYLSRTYELGRKDEIKRGAIATETTSFLEKVTIQPFAGYDRTRNFFAGTKVKSELPENSLFRTAEVDVGGSNTAQELKAELEGKRDYWTGFIRHQEWRVNYKFSNVPADRLKLQQNFGTAQYYAASKSVSKAQMIFRFGGSLDIGNETSDVTAGDLAPRTVAGGQVTSGKFFVGTSFKLKNQTFKASYGVQLGSVKGGQGLDFIKQIFDAGAKFDFSALTSEVGFTYGNLDTRGVAPIAERFFGGNRRKDFIDGSAWFINAQPFIRGFSVNRLASPESTNLRGGDRFAAFNMTTSFRVWRRRLVPKAAWEDPDNPGQLMPDIANKIEFPFQLGEEVLMYQYLDDTVEFSGFKGDTEKIDGILKKLKPLLEKIPESETVRKRLFKAAPEGGLRSGYFDRVEIRVDEIQKALRGDEIFMPLSKTIELLTVDTAPDEGDDVVPPCSEDGSLILSYMSEFIGCLEMAKPFLNPADQAKLDGYKGQLQSSQTSLADKFDKLTHPPENSLEKKRLDAARARAKEEMLYPRAVLDYLLRKADLYSFSPMFVYDAVQLKQNGLTRNPWRSSVGTGIKFRFIFVDVSAGYAWTVNRRPGEQKGAVFFNLEIIDLLR